MPRTGSDIDTWIARIVIAVCTLYALTRLEAIFPVVPAGATALRFFDHDAFFAEYPEGVLGMVPVYTCSAMQNCPPVDPRVIGVLDDPMLSTGFAFVFLGLWLSMWLDPIYRNVRAQLGRDGVVDWTAADDAVIEARRRQWSLGLGLLVFLLVAMGFLIFHYRGLPPNGAEWELFSASCVLGALAGHRLGASAAYGTVGHRINRQSRQVSLVVGHVDGAGGARRLGEFLAFQGVLVSIAIIWLAIVVEVPAFFIYYGTWWQLHLALLIVALVVSWFGFIRPLLIFTRHYRAAKGCLLDDWQKKTFGTLDELQRHYFKTGDWEEAKEAITKAEGITSVSARISSLSSIPLRASVRGVFSLATLFPVATLLVEVMMPEKSALAQVLATGVDWVARLLS